MLRAGLGRRRCRCGGGLWRSPCPAAVGGSASPRYSRALSAASASPSNGGGAWGGGAPPAGASNVKPLDGVKILDLTRVLAGPFATMNLGDLGAEVIKVERPGAGDDTRAWGPPFAGTESVYFLSVNRNKKSIAINMKDSKGVKLIRELAAVSDVFVENYLPGKLAEMGLGYEDIKKIAPHIVYCSITGYGQTGPMVQRGGYDSIAAAVSGLMHITGHEDGEPVRPGVAMTDLATGLYTYGAIMAGLLQRYKTGKGLHIDCNLLSSQVACLTHVAANYLNCKIEAKRWGTAHGSIVPYQILNLPEVSKDSRYKTNALRVQNRKELTDILSTRFSEKTTIEWLQLFEGSGVPYGPINNMQQVFSDPQVLHNGLVMEMNHPTAGRIAVPGPGVRYSEFAVSHPKPPPLVGQHTVEILKGMLGYNDDAIEELLRTGAVAQHEILFLVSLPRDLPMHLEIPAWLSAMGTLELTFKSRPFLISGREQQVTR
ncbi:succinate--hydroxymethylglutarate CoA-transferase isoform X2 [Grus americana]|uniref:succinate--hydroxymethylglutarate CoA-transferase isoform X2 n=1 Tax=Grus americana TaxID=9117 RepID=UPI002407C9DA|nr:succinate--hydroxymethylglutarate CoA-transferase isoform X2 [Grus americana]